MGRKKETSEEENLALSSCVSEAVLEGAPACANQVRGGVFATVLYIALHFCLDCCSLTYCYPSTPLSCQRDVRCSARASLHPGHHATIWLKKIGPLGSARFRARGRSTGLVAQRDLHSSSSSSSSSSSVKLRLIDRTIQMLRSQAEFGEREATRY